MSEPTSTPPGGHGAQPSAPRPSASRPPMPPPPGYPVPHPSHFPPPGAPWPGQAFPPPQQPLGVGPYPPPGVAWTPPGAQPYAMPPGQFAYPTAWGMPAPPMQGPVPPPGFKRVVRPSCKERITALLVAAASVLSMTGSLYLPLLVPKGQPWSSGIIIGQYTPHLAEGADVLNWLFILYFVSTLVAVLGGLTALAGWGHRVVTTAIMAALSLMLGVGALMGLLVLLFLFSDELSVGPAWTLNTLGGAGLMVACLKPRWRAALERPLRRPRRAF